MKDHEIKNDDIIIDIKNRIAEITSGEKGMPVYLKGVIFPENNSRGSSQCFINASCLFINEEDNVCADLFRTGSAGFMECASGAILGSVGRRGLEEIYAALTGDRWFISEAPKSAPVKNRKRSVKGIAAASFRFSFHMKS